MSNETEQITNKLEGLHEVLLGICTLFAVSVPEDKYRIRDNYFNLYKLETIKLLFGRICIILFDKKNDDYNTISYKILIEEILKCESLELDQDKKNNLKKYMQDIKEIEKKYKNYRDKAFAHIELGENNNLVPINEYKISPENITKMIDLAKEIDNLIFVILNGGAIDHMRSDLEKLSDKIWKAYEEKGLVENTLGGQQNP